MKILLVLGLAFGAAVSFVNQVATTKGQNQGAVFKPQSNALEISLTVNKRKYRKSEMIKLQVMLINSGYKDVYVFRTLQWGSAGLLLHLRDISGKEIEPRAYPDDLTRESPDDQTAFVKLPPLQFLGINSVSGLKFLNLTKPGKYSIYVEYNSPFSMSEVKLSPFWGKDSGTLKSNLVHIEVLP